MATSNGHICMQVHPLRCPLITNPIQYLHFTPEAFNRENIYNTLPIMFLSIGNAIFTLRVEIMKRPRGFRRASTLIMTSSMNGSYQCYNSLIHTKMKIDHHGYPSFPWFWPYVLHRIDHLDLLVDLKRHTAP